MCRYVVGDKGARNRNSRHLKFDEAYTEKDNRDEGCNRERAREPERPVQQHEAGKKERRAKYGGR